MGVFVSWLRIFVKLGIKFCAIGIGLFYKQDKGLAPGLRVLLYHRVNPFPFSQLSMTSREISVSPEAFDRQMAYLHLSGYRTIGLDRLESLLANPDTIDAKEILITFDDGYEDNLQWAVPILEKYGFTAVFFLITGFMAKGLAEKLWYEEGSPEQYRKFLIWPQVQELVKRGFWIGSHSLSHPDLNKLDDDELLTELTASKAILEERLSIPVTSFAYPRGIFNDKIMQATQKAGYQIAFTTEVGINYPKFSELALNRTDISASDTLFLFKQKMAGNLDWFDMKKWPIVRASIDFFNRFIISTLQHKESKADP